VSAGFDSRRSRGRHEAPGLTRIRLGLTLAGLILWGYGAHADVEWLRWTGIALFAVTVALQLVRARSEHSDANAPNDRDE
jgi:hypothetical protein